MFQQLVIVGNLGKDPEMRYTPSGAPVTSFSVATSRQYTSNTGETIKETAWFRVTTWGKSAEACNQYLKKGSKVLVVGRLTSDKETGGPRIWTAQDGTPKASYEVTASEVKFLSDRKAGGETAGAEFAGAPEDDIPF